MRIFLFLVFTVVWAAAGKLIDFCTHSFWFALLGGLIVALFILVILSSCKAAAMADDSR